MSGIYIEVQELRDVKTYLFVISCLKVSSYAFLYYLAVISTEGRRTGHLGSRFACTAVHVPVK